jgi:hypothetical protein
MDKKLRAKINKAVIEGIRRNGDRIFDLSQDTARGFVPTDRGILKQSGYTRNIRNGVEIGYKAPYASIIEIGMPESYYKGTQVVHIKKHQMMYKGKKVWVKAHDKKYVNKRLVRIRSRQSWSRDELEASYGLKIPGDVSRMTIYGPHIFVVMDKIPARQGQYFLTKAVIKGIKKLPEDLKWSLGRVGTTS